MSDSSPHRPLPPEQVPRSVPCASCGTLVRSPRVADEDLYCDSCQNKTPHPESNEVKGYRTMASANDPPAGDPDRTIKRRRRSGEGAQWGTQSGDTATRKQKARVTFALATVILALGALALVVIPVFTKSDENWAKSLQASPDVRLVKVSDAEVSEAIEVALEFLNAATLEELATLIRKPEEIMPLVRDYYPNGSYQPVGSREIDSRGSTQTSGRFISFSALLSDFSSQPIAVEITEEGPRVDWESWVGYCEIPWEEFLAKRITTPTLVRVRAIATPYYNFAFSSDSDWVCYQLSQNDAEPAVYGYAAAEAPFINQLPPSHGVMTTLTLRVRFPKDAASDNQIIIDDFVAAGWVPDIER